MRYFTDTITGMSLVVVFATIASQISAGESSCGYCGSCQHVKNITRLVRTYEEVKLPVYECKLTDVFVPDKGKVCHTGYRCDSFPTLHKHCDCSSACCGKQACDCTTTCCQRTHCDCKTHYGAKPTGCHTAQCVNKPTGEYCVKKVPVFRWIAVPVCDECCKAAHRHASSQHLR